MPFVQCLWLEVFVEKRVSATLKTAKAVAMETKMCDVIKLWTSFQKKLNSRLCGWLPHQMGLYTVNTLMTSSMPLKLSVIFLLS